MNPRKKVMHVTFVRGGGVEIYTAMLIGHTNIDYETVLVCSGDYRTQALPAGVRVYPMEVPREISPVADMAATWKLRRILRKERPQVLYCHSAKAGAIGRLAAVGLGCKVLYNPHGWAFSMDGSPKKQKFYGLLERLLAPLAHKIITISEYEKRIALENRICPEGKLQVIENGVDIACFREMEGDRAALGFGEDDLIVGCAARLSAQKDPLLFAQVAGLIAKKVPNARFLWIGDGELRAGMEEALRRNGVLDKTTITGWVWDVRKWLAVLDVAVLFSRWEGFGLCLAEYMAQGTPIVATAVGAIPEIVTPEVGLLCEDRDPARLAQLVLEAKRMDSPRARCLRRDIAREKYDFTRTAVQTKQLIDQT